MGTAKWLPYLPRQLDSTAFAHLREPCAAPVVPPRHTSVCLECASPFSTCPVYGSPVRKADGDGAVLLADVAQCWCMQCEHNAESAAARGMTHNAALRASHDAQELERLIFETAAVHGQWLWQGKVLHEKDWDAARALDWSSAHVPVLYLRHFLMRPDVFKDDHMWDCGGGGGGSGGRCPPWLTKTREKIDALRDGGVLDAVLAPFSTTLYFVSDGGDGERATRHLLDERHEFLARTYHLEVPDAVRRAPTRHRIARAALLRVAVAYDLMAAFNGCKWDFNLVDVEVPWLRNAKLQALDLHAQLFADTHLDLLVMCELHARRYDDTFMASSLADSGFADSEYAKSTAAPLALSMSMFERFFPHPVRAPFGGELASLGSPLHATNSMASSSSSASNTVLDAVLRFIFLKPLNYRAMCRSFADIGTRHMRDYPAIMQHQLNTIEVSQLGNFGGGARMRPRWQARLVVRRSFHFDKLHFEPQWCPNCGTSSKHFAKITVSGNACPWCKPVHKALWCANECMRAEFKLREQVELHMHEEEDNPNNYTRATGSGARKANAARSNQDKVRNVELEAAFAELQASEHGVCPHCAKEQARRAEPNSRTKPMSPAQLLTYHFSNDHVCDFCATREHDDAEYVRKAAAESRKKTKKTAPGGPKRRGRRAAAAKVTDELLEEEEEEEEEAAEDEAPPPPPPTVSESERQMAAQIASAMADFGNKMLCSSHVCEPCRMLRDNDRYCFSVMKESLAFMIECHGLMEDQFTQSRSWEPYKRMLNEGMDEVRTIVDAQFSLTAKNEWVAFREPSDRLWQLVLEHVRLSHRCAQPTVTTMQKGSFMKLLKECMSTYKGRHFLNKMLTRPQRAIDFLRSPAAILECAEDAHDAKTVGEYKKLAQWRERGFKPDDVRRCAALAANISITDTEERACPIFFNMLKFCGVTRHGVETIQMACYDHEVCAMPDHRLEDYVRKIAEHSRTDFYVLQYFCETFLQREPIRVFPLELAAARAQTLALRSRCKLMPYEWAPEDIDVRYVCLCCAKWYAPIVEPVKYGDIPRIIEEGGGDAARLSEEISAVGHGNLKHNLRTGELMCSRDFKSSSSKKYKSYGMLDSDLSFATAVTGGKAAAASKASSIRKMRERGSDCSTKPLTAIAMLGVMVRIRGNMYALCGHCGSLFTVPNGKFFADGVPDCGRHVVFGDPRAYTALRAFRSPFAEPVHSGKWLAYGHQLLPEQQSVHEPESCAFNRAAIDACVGPLQYEYAAPSKVLTVQAMNDEAAHALVPCTPSITHPKGIIEAMAVTTIERVFLEFGRSARAGSSNSAPQLAPTPDDDELEMALAHNLMTYAAAERRIRREEEAERRAVHEAHVELFDDSPPPPATAAAAAAGGVAVPERALRMRVEIHNEMLLRGGCIEHEVMIICAYCGRMCDKNGAFTRVYVLDFDRLCRNRNTRELCFMAHVDRTALVAVFLCEKDFNSLKPILCHWPVPTSAMVFVWLRCENDKVLQVEKGKRGTSSSSQDKGHSASDLLAVARVSNGGADVFMGATVRARMSATPTVNSMLSMGGKPRRGRPVGSGRGGMRGSSGRRSAPGGGGGRGGGSRKK